MSKRSIPDSGKSRQLLADAVTALRRQQPQEAERLASVVLHADPDDVAAAGVLGRALLIQNRAAEAMMPLERAAQRTADPEIETLLALALSATGQAEQALDRLRMAATRRRSFAWRSSSERPGNRPRGKAGVAETEGFEPSIGLYKPITV